MLVSLKRYRKDTVHLIPYRAVKILQNLITQSLSEVSLLVKKLSPEGIHSLSTEPCKPVTQCNYFVVQQIISGIYYTLLNSIQESHKATLATCHRWKASLLSSRTRLRHHHIDQLHHLLLHLHPILIP